ncbi:MULTISPECIES: hypothetical protein [unclassified Sphingomonas]|jgi:hypothetical protein|uniref:hypothetical protein n=1 Tax=unclassified Sphingomonas TaxID=196159 RepID=UPI0018E05DFC|nr:hypothetical protein [Sphingomonas sp. TX0522]
MPQPVATTAMILERLAGELHSAAFDFEADVESHGRAEDRIANVERIAAEARAAVRGRSRA